MAHKKKRFGECTPFPCTDAVEQATVAEEGVSGIVGASDLGLRRERGRSFESPLLDIVGSGVTPARAAGGGGPADSSPATRTGAPSASPPVVQTLQPSSQPVGAHRPPVRITPTSPGKLSIRPRGFGR